MYTKVIILFTSIFLILSTMSYVGYRYFSHSTTNNTQSQQSTVVKNTKNDKETVVLNKKDQSRVSPTKQRAKKQDLRAKKAIQRKDSRLHTRRAKTVRQSSNLEYIPRPDKRESPDGN